MSKFIMLFCSILFIAFLVICLIGCGDDSQTAIQTQIRSSNPHHTIWNDIVTPEIQGAKPDHLDTNLIIYYSSVENNANVVLMLSLLESEQLLSRDENFGDFEIRLYNAAGYDITNNNNLASDKYGGFFPQLVAGSYQFWLDEKNGLSFAESYQNNFASQMNLEKFMAVYLDIAQIMNQIAHTNYPSPDPATQEIFGQFKEVTADQIQNFLEQCPNTALKRKTLFREGPVTNSINYQ
ncbi:MAG TPA: hypothetical protein PLZ62_01540 [bacterium]|nr:hypothetical protein [bacterium]